MDATPDNNTAVLASLGRTLRRLLSPVSTILLRHGLSYRELTDACKESYVKAAAAEEAGLGKTVNVSRVALVTGMARRDVRNILGKPDDARPLDVRRNNATRVLSAWHQDPEYTDATGKPVKLPADGPAPSFEALVRKYASDIPPGTIAKDLVRVRSVSRTGEGGYQVDNRDYRPAKEFTLTPEVVERSGSVLEDIGNTIDHNLHRAADEPGRFERRATNVKVSVDAVPEFRQFVDKEALQFLEKVDAWLSEHEVGEGEAHCRLGIGTYWIQDKTSGEQS